ncbi:phenylalanine--tRNA ligase subunit alpha [Buchnera aphidicola (Neophyllaphis podocarpi)]|uniref:phenylalanine--tRNA ligase subunit alpha n=1 Tax=Buchnera aphidicola TaxID=9 RepID=UPI0031B8470D
MFDIKKFLYKSINDINLSQTVKDLNLVKSKYLGKKSLFKQEFFKIKRLENNLKKNKLDCLNKLKLKILQKINLHKKKLEKILILDKICKDKLDISLPGRFVQNGGLHPLTITTNYIKNYFSRLGFKFVDGPEIEDAYHNFDALNISNNHPARDTNDTFWLNANLLLRTQTSGVQIREMKKHNPPIRIISIGKVYRRDSDKTHTPMFHQLEVLVVDIGINFSNLKWIIYNFLHDFFGKAIKLRFRTSYFPFTTISGEVDVLNEFNKWIEVLGCGIVHPKVLSNVNIDSNIYSGIAFGIGIERITMLRYGISDLKYFFENDLHFLTQFK